MDAGLCEHSNIYTRYLTDDQHPPYPVSILVLYLNNWLQSCVYCFFMSSWMV